MNAKGLLKVAVLLIVMVAVAPFVLQLFPEPLTFDAARSGFEAAGFEVLEHNMLSTPQLGAVRQMTLQLGASGGPLSAAIYQFSNEGALRKQYEYNKPDPGAGIAQSFVMGAGLGPARKPKPVAVGRNGMLLIVVTGDSDADVTRAARVFESL